MKFGTYNILSLEENMKKVCENARKIGTGYADGYRLEFRSQEMFGISTLTINRSQCESVPMVVWEIAEDDVDKLKTDDESVKVCVKIKTDDGLIDAVTFANNYIYDGIVNPMELSMLFRAYDENGFDKSIVRKATEVIL